MIGHQRDILSALGIDLWIPRETLCQKSPDQNIWRDQAAPEIITTLTQPQLVMQQEMIADLSRRPIVEVVPVAVDTKTVESAPLEIIQPVLEVESFIIQAAVLKHGLLLIDATVFNEQEQLLWVNIQRAMQCDFVELQWPFAWQNAQNGRGAASYLNGFIDAYRLGKPVLAIGHVPYLESSTVVQLASLAEMLEQPLLKKRLWQFMQNIPNVE
jgi:hypothetical protein